MNLTVIGLGKLGLPSAACLAWGGHKVIGVDVDVAHVARLQRGVNTIQEPDLNELLDREDVRANLSFSTDIASSVVNADVILVIVPTPAQADCRFSNTHVIDALEEIGKGLRNRNYDEFGAPIIDIVSTVMPGSCSKSLIRHLEDAFDLECGDDFGFVYNPEFIALGSVVKNFLNPDMVLIGESHEGAGMVVEKMYQQMFSKCISHQLQHPSFHHMSLTDAEITKLCLNVYLSIKIGYANLLGAEVIPLLGGSDPDAILNAIGDDSRIGKKLLRPGMAVGGPCLCRDHRALDVALSDATSRLNDPSCYDVPRDALAVVEFPDAITSLAAAGNSAVMEWHYYNIDVHAKDPILFLGVSYKPGTHVLDESKSLRILQNAVGAGRKCLWHDPYVESLGYDGGIDHVFTGPDGGSITVSLPPILTRVNILPDAIREAGAIVILTPHVEYQALRWDEYDNAVKFGTPLIDCWRLWPVDKVWKNFKYIAMGREEGYPTGEEGP